jgi:hypothetical protein
VPSAQVVPVKRDVQHTQVHRLSGAVSRQPIHHPTREHLAPRADADHHDRTLGGHFVQHGGQQTLQRLADLDFGKQRFHVTFIGH